MLGYKILKINIYLLKFYMLILLKLYKYLLIIIPGYLFLIGIGFIIFMISNSLNLYYNYYYCLNYCSF